MTFGAIEVLAFLLVLFGGVKLILLAIKPDFLFNLSSKLFKKTKLFQVLTLIGTAVILYFLLDAGLSIVQILAVTFFAAALYGMALAPYAEKMTKAIKSKTVLKDNLLVVLVWVVLLVWGIIGLFF